MNDSFWAITCYFNPMRWRRRLANYRVFRRHLRVPLVTVELGYDGKFELGAGDADILVQMPGDDVMWQKERLLNIALGAVPPTIEKIANLDCDAVIERTDVWDEASRVLQRTPITQLFSHVFYLPADYSLDFELMRQTCNPGPGFGWLRQQGCSPLELCNPSWTNPNDHPPVSYGLAWAFRREVFAGRGFYDPWVVGGAMRLHFFAAGGHWREAAEAFRFYPAMQEDFRRWTIGFHADVRGEWGCVSGAVAHLWHGDMGRRKHRQRYAEFAGFDFDPKVDLALDNYGAWRWNSKKPAMHQYIRRYIAQRQEDGVAAESDANAGAPAVSAA